MKTIYCLTSVLILFITFSVGLSHPKNVISTNVGETKESSTNELLNKISFVSGRRTPKFGVFPNITLPFPLPGFGPTNISDPTGDGSFNINNPFTGIGSPATATATIGSSAILIKGGLLKGLGALKAAIVPPLFLGALILFLIAGAAFFACSVLDCGNLVGGGGLGGGGQTPYGSSGGFGSSLFNLNRNSYDQFEQQQQQSRPLYQALDDSYKKYS